MIIGILGILKAGAAYMPMDTTYPQNRLRMMAAQVPGLRFAVASDAAASIARKCGVSVLNYPELEDQLAEMPSGNPSVTVSGNDLCYVVSTSGSTGVPKATAVRHVGWLNLLNWLAVEFALDSQSSNLMVSSFGFDISQRSLMTPLYTGAALHLLPSRTFDPLMACKLIEDLGIRTLHCAPSTLYLMIERVQAANPGQLSSLEYVFVGGEPLSARRVADWARKPNNKTKLVNVYGVAECTDVSSAYTLSDYPKYIANGVPIGTPIYNIDINILDGDLAAVAAGEVGEICISGPGVGAATLTQRP